jgi:PTS system nitrogen regulatory IIA component
MIIGELLEEGLILPSLAARTKNAVLAELVAAAGDHVPGLDAATALKVLKEREKLGTTGIGDGVAIPHGKMDCIERIVLVVGRSEQGVEFDALDHKPCTIFFLVLAPEQVVGQHLRVLAGISRLLKDDAFRRSFLAAPGADGLLRLLRAC